MIIKLSEEWDKALEKASKTLRDGGIIIYPTDTLYGIGGDATNIEVVKKIYKIKKREISKPLTVVVSGLRMLLEYFEPNGREILEIQKYFPGPYTFILKRNKEKKLLFGEEEIGVRVPDHYFCRKLSEEIGKPIISTSANISGEKPAIEIEDINEELLKEVQIVIDGGASKYKYGSTIINIRKKLVIRQGYGKYSFNYD